MKVLGFLFLGLLIGGCAAIEPKAKIDTSLEEELGPYSGPKASLAVSKFQWKVGRKDEGVGDGLEDMLTTLLVQSKRFKVLEREELEKVKKEGEYIDKTQKIKGAEILVVAAITGWEPGIEKTGGAIGAQGGFLGAILGSFKRSYLAMDIRLIDSATSEVLAATNVEGEAKEFDLGGLAGGMFSSVPLAGALSKYSKTPMEKAIRVCMKEALKYILQNIPPSYFKY